MIACGAAKVARGGRSTGKRSSAARVRTGRRTTGRAKSVFGDRLRLAATYLTSVRWYRGPRPTPAQTAAAVPLLPVVGSVLGLALGLVEWGARALIGIQALSCSLAVGLGVLLTGRLLLEAITAFGALLAPFQAEEVLTELRHGVRRPTGVLAVLILALARYAALLALAPAQRLPALVLAEGLGASMLVWAAWRFPYARHQGDFGEAFAHYLGPQDLVLAVPLLALSLAAFGTWAGAATFFLPGGALHLGAWLVARRLGGLTGELYAGLYQLAAVAVLGVAAWLG